MKLKLKILSLLLAVLTLCTSLSACSNPAEPEGETPSESEASETEESSKPAPEESAGSEEKLPLNCEYVLIDELENFGPTGILEFEGSLLILNYGKDLLAYNSKTGEKLYEISLSDESSPAKLFATEQKEGYDCCVAYNDCIVYLNSKDPKAVLKEELPVEIDCSKLLYPERTYSFYGENFVYLAPDGIRMLNLNENKEKLLLKNSEIPKKLVSKAEPLTEGSPYLPEGTAPFGYFDVQFLSGGKKLAFRAASWEYTFVCFGIYNIESDEIEIVFSHLEQYGPQYSFGDENIYFQNFTSLKIINAATLEITDYAYNGPYTIIPEKQLSVWYDCKSKAHELLSVFYCPDKNYNDRSNCVLSVSDESFTCDILLASDDSLYIALYKEQKCFLVAVKI